MTDQTARPIRTADEIRTCGHTPTQHRTIDGLEADLRTTTRERAEVLDEISQAWAALNQAGYTHPSATVADLIRRCAADRDTARHLVDVRTAALERRTAERDGARRIADILRDDIAAQTNARRQTAAERPNGPGEGMGKGDAATEAHRGAEDGDSLTDRLAGALADALGWFRYRSGPHHYTARIPERSITAWRAVYAEWADMVAPEGRETDDAPPPGSGGDHAQDLGEPAGYEVVVSRLHHGPRGLTSGDVVVSAVVDATDATTATDALAQVQRALGAPEPIRPADWERKAIDVVTAALADAWPHPTPDLDAKVAVRAIIDAGLAGPGGRCPACGSTYPRTMPAGEDPRCWTCSSEPDPVALDEHAPAVARVLDNVRNGRPAGAR